MRSFGMKAKTSLKIGSVPSIFPFQEPKNERVSSQSRTQKQNNLLKKVETEQVALILLLIYRVSKKTPKTIENDLLVDLLELLKFA